MGFRDARQQAIEALLAGTYQNEARNDIDETNLLAVGLVTPNEVAGLLNACRGTQYECQPHHEIAKDVEVHIFKPECSLRPDEPRRQWYVKLYFLAPDTWFISVHPGHRSGSR